MRKLTNGNSYVYKQKRADAAETSYLNIDGRNTFWYYIGSNKDCSDYRYVVV